MRFAQMVLLGLLVGCAASGPQPASAKLEWVFQPDRSVAVKVDGKSHPVLNQPPYLHQPLEPSEFKGYHIPANAVIAAFSWHAGFGDVIYAIPKGDQIQVFQREMDESETRRFPSKQIATIGPSSGN